MPRKSGSKEKFVSLNVELSTKQELEKHRLPGEPLYRTAHRMFHKYLETDMEDAEFMIKEYKNSSENWKNKYFELLSEKNRIERLEKFV